MNFLITTVLPLFPSASGLYPVLCPHGPTLVQPHHLSPGPLFNILVSKLQMLFDASHTSTLRHSLSHRAITSWFGQWLSQCHTLNLPLSPVEPPWFKHAASLGFPPGAPILLNLTPQDTQRVAQTFSCMARSPHIQITVWGVLSGHK